MTCLLSRLFRSILLVATVTWVTSIGLAQTDPEQPDAAARARQHVRTALQFELEGDYAYRERLLALALRTDPDCAAARWQQGDLRLDDEWIAADHERFVDEPLRATYRDMRDKALGDAARELKLARWCHRNQLEDVARLHYTRLLLNSQEPNVRREAIRRLDLRVWNGQLVRAADWECNRNQAKAAVAALKKWRPKLERLRERSDEPGRASPTQSDERDSLAQLVTVESLAAVESFVTDSGPHFGEQLVGALAQLPQYEATQTLMRYAVLSPWTSVQDAACDALEERSLHEFVPALLAALENPIKTRFSVRIDRGGNVLYQHLFLREAVEGNQVVASEHLARSVTERVSIRLAPNPNDPRTINNSAKVASDAAALRTIGRLAKQARRREAEVQAQNLTTNSRNSSVFRVLEATTGLRMNRYPEDWRCWWQEYNESGSRKQTYVDYRPETSNYVGQYQVHVFRPGRSSSCFAAGTLVWTDDGLRRIDELVPGDRVLSQDPNTGELQYVPIWQRTEAAPASQMARLDVADDVIEITKAHVVWRVGEGWKMIKEIQAGDRIAGRTVGTTVDRVADGVTPDLVYNLVVPDTHTFFVGRSGVLVHDITYRQPTNALIPGLLP